MVGEKLAWIMVVFYVWQKQGRCFSNLGICYESLERLIGISHKYWNHGKINGGQKRHHPFGHPKWRYPYQERCELPDLTPSDHFFTTTSSLLFISDQATAT